jgi:hypothetical protein
LIDLHLQLQESPKYLLAKGRDAEAIAVCFLACERSVLCQVEVEILA